MELKQKIAENLEHLFSQHGFAQPSVTNLQNASGVSLRTLYRYFPSKESMVVGALEHRHQYYLSFLTKDCPKSNTDAIKHIFNRLEVWMNQYAPNGCMSNNAVTAFPDNELINDAVKKHKQEVLNFIQSYCEQEETAIGIFLLHEGASSTWPIIGKKVITPTQDAALLLLHGEQ